MQRVADGRKKDYNVVEPLAQGRVWLGSQALKNGLVDEIGGLDRAVALIKEKAKIPAADKITLVPFPEKRTLLQVLLNRDQPAVRGRHRDHQSDGRPPLALARQWRRAANHALRS